MRYVLRALEVLRLTGERKSERTRIPDPDHQYLLLCLTKPREVLYEKINARHEAMFTEGLVEEVEALYKKGYGKETPAMNTIGYKEVGDYLRGEITLERAKELVKQHARNYAKRQMTWFRKMDGIHWVEM
jgi:tRNA dimethylallyltransferase